MASKKEMSKKIKYSNAKTVAKHHVESQETGGAIRLPQGITIYKIGKPDRYRFDIIPFKVKKDNPAVRAGMVEEGSYHWERLYYRHGGVGPENKMVACLRKNWGKPCPCCEDMQEYEKTMDRNDDEQKKALNQMKPKARQMYLVLDRDTSREPHIQVFEHSWHMFGEALAEKIDAADDRNGYDRFFHLEGGLTLDVKFSAGTFANSFEATNIEMKARSRDLPESLLDEAPCLDDMVVELSYEKIRKMIDGLEEEDEPVEEASKPAKKGGKATKPAEDEEEDEEEEEEIEEKEEEEEAPSKKSQTKRAAAKKEEEEEDEDDDEDEDGDDEDEESEDDEDDEDEEDEDEGNPAARAGLEVGTYVMYGKKRCKVVKVNVAGTAVTLEDEKTKELYRSVEPKECKVGVPVDESAAKKTSAKRKPPVNNDDDWGDDEDDAPPAPKTRRR